MTFKMPCRIPILMKWTTKVKVYLVYSVIGRIGLCTLVQDPSYDELLGCVLTPESIQDLVIVIALDWNMPWEFMSELKRWLDLLHGHVQTLDSDMAKGLKQRVETLIRKYKEPGADLDTFGLETAVPLGLGLLTKNLGIPLAIVCHKVS